MAWEGGACTPIILVSRSATGLTYPTQGRTHIDGYGPLSRSATGLTYPTQGRTHIDGYGITCAAFNIPYCFVLHYCLRIPLKDTSFCRKKKKHHFHRKNKECRKYKKQKQIEVNILLHKGDDWFDCGFKNLALIVLVIHRFELSISQIQIESPFHLLFVFAMPISYANVVALTPPPVSPSVSHGRTDATASLRDPNSNPL
ncbi:hypothetical protein YC2023_083627 [Brassica napus]